MKVILASQNQHKLVELSAILSQLGFEIALESEYGLHVDVDETGTTFEENSLLKAEAVMKASGMPVLADDSGLMVDALDGAPGVQIRAALEKKSGFVQWLTVTALLLAVLLLGVFRAGYIPSGFIYTQF